MSITFTILILQKQKFAHNFTLDSRMITKQLKNKKSQTSQHDFIMHVMFAHT